jgi:O-antigen/teichoic acid export membrane protein
VTQTLFGGAGTVWILKTGHGIVLLAATQLAISVLLGILTTVLCFQVYPQLQVHFKFLNKKALSELWRYSFYLFIIAASGQVIYYTDNLVVGAFLSAEAVTFFAIGGRFLDYLGQLGASLAQTFMPVASSLAVGERSAELRRLLIQGTRAALFVSLPIAWVLFFRSHTFIGLWMGPQYSETSGKILRILLISSIAINGNRVGGNIILGLGKHKRFALWQLCEAMANLALSVYLVRKIGITGVAWGTVVPSLISQLLLWPRYLSKVLGLTVWRYFWDGWIRAVLATTPFGVICFWIDHRWATPSMAVFLLQIAVALPSVPLGIILLFWPEVNSQLRTPGSLFRKMFLAKRNRMAAP